MNDWVELRDHLRAEVGGWLQEIIMTDPDRRLRAYLAIQRETLIERLVDQVELELLRRHVAGYPREPAQLLQLSPRTNSF
jgi:hypothetical protein